MMGSDPILNQLRGRKIEMPSVMCGLEIAQLSVEQNMVDNDLDSDDNTIRADSVRRKRKKKMNKHKHAKRRKLNRHRK